MKINWKNSKVPKLKFSPHIKKNFVIFLKNFLDEYVQVRPKSTVLSHYHDRGFLASQPRVHWWLLFILTIALRCQTRRIEVNKYLIGCVENGPLRRIPTDNTCFACQSGLGNIHFDIAHLVRDTVNGKK